MEVQKLTVTVCEMAKMLGISRPTAYELTKRDGFPAIRVSDRLIIIPVDRLKKWLDEAPTISEEIEEEKFGA
ncbi:MAG: helix-turn-helix domain-containing protein [Thermoguttaceae bacterium]|nr:helix-turn-helix domain-containing protein [Thermoguttaceae bacterium]